MSIDSFTLFTSSSNNLNLSVSPLSSINNINEELLKIHSKITQQQNINQTGGKNMSDSYNTSNNKYESVIDSNTSSDSSNSSSFDSSDTSFETSSEYSVFSSTTDKSKHIPNQHLSSTNNFETMYGSDSELTSSPTQTSFSVSNITSNSTSSSYPSSKISKHHNTNYLPENSSYTKSTIPVLPKKITKQKRIAKPKKITKTKKVK